MGISISKFSKLISDLCSEISCRTSCCGSGCMFEFDNKDGSPAHIVHSSASDDSIATTSTKVLPKVDSFKQEI